MKEETITCANCGSSKPNVVIEAGTPKEVRCPQCGDSQSYEEFRRSISPQVHNYAVAHIAKAFGGRGSKRDGITFKPGRQIRVNPKFRIKFN